MKNLSVILKLNDTKCSEERCQNRIAVLIYTNVMGVVKKNSYRGLTVKENGKHVPVKFTAKVIAWRRRSCPVGKSKYVRSFRRKKTVCFSITEQAPIV